MATLQLTVSLPDDKDPLLLLANLCSAQRTEPAALVGPAFTPVAIGRALACSLLPEPDKSKVSGAEAPALPALPAVVDAPKQSVPAPLALAPLASPSKANKAKAKEAKPSIEKAKPTRTISKRAGKAPAPAPEAAAATVSSAHLVKLADNVLRETARASDEQLMKETNAAFWALVAALERKAQFVKAAHAEHFCELMVAFRSVHGRFQGAHEQILKKSKSLEVTRDVRELMTMWKNELLSVGKDGGVGIGSLKQLLKSLALMFGKYGAAWIKSIKGMQLSSADHASMGGFFMFFDTASRDAAGAVAYERQITAKDLKLALKNRNAA